MHRPSPARSTSRNLLAALGAALFGAEIAERLARDPHGTNFKRERRTLFNRANADRNRENRRAIYKSRSAYQGAVNQLTNHERNLWARAGYPGQSSDSIEAVLQFSVKHRMAKLAERR